MNTSGFYKFDRNNLLYGKNFVLNSAYELRRETHDQHTYPIDGWKWFDSEEEARVHYNAPKSLLPKTIYFIPEILLHKNFVPE
jgi:hypothetical protein